jgi:hypothetical protein
VKDIINKPEVSKNIAFMYGIVIVFLIALTIFFSYNALFTPMGTGGYVSAVVVAIVDIIIILIFRSLYTTRYIITENDLIIKTTKLIGGNKTIPLENIESVDGTLIPFGIRLFGASFHGGYYKIPNIGRAFLAITNYNDGLLIKSKQGNYIITPKDSAKFKKALEK